MNEKKNEGKIMGAKLRKRAKLMHKHGASRDLIGVILEAADRLARLGRENERLRRKIEGSGLFGPLSGVAIGLSSHCKYHDCAIVRTLDGHFKAIREGEAIPAGWVKVFDAQRGTKAATIFSRLKGVDDMLPVEPVGAKRSAPKQKAKAPSGRVVAPSTPVDMAAKIAGWIGASPVDLYREPSGAVRVMKAGAEMSGAEFLGRFDEGATVQDIAEVIE